MSTKKLQILNSTISGAIRYDVEQNLTEEEKEQVRENVNAASVQFITWEDDD
jgi:hypothetical protein